MNSFSKIILQNYFEKLLTKKLCRGIIFNSVKIKYFTGDNMIKNLNIAILMDFYGGMLTDKRYTALDMYYNQDMSLAEIAEEIEISRQGVRDSIKHGEKQLLELEDKLGLVKRFTDIKSSIKAMNDILAKSEDFDGIDDIKSILKKIDDAV